MNETAINEILSTCNCVAYKNPLSSTLVPKHFPDLHKNLLCLYSRLSSFHGYYTLFALSGPLNLQIWNSDETWKYPLKGMLDNYVVIAKTALGVQFAYSTSDLLSNKTIVYEINFEDFYVDVAYNSFNDFFKKEFVGNSTSPYDTAVVEAFNRFGEVGHDEILLYMPPLLLGGVENANNLNKTDAINGMKYMADLKMSFDEFEDDDRIAGVSQYIDEKNRIRWRVDKQLL